VPGAASKSAGNLKQNCSSWRDLMLCVLVAGGMSSGCVAESLSELCNIQQLDALFICYSLLAEISGPDSPAYTSYCLTAYAVVMQMWQVCAPASVKKGHQLLLSLASSLESTSCMIPSALRKSLC